MAGMKQLKFMPANIGGLGWNHLYHNALIQHYVHFHITNSIGTTVTLVLILSAIFRFSLCLSPEIKSR